MAVGSFATPLMKSDYRLKHFKILVNGDSWSLTETKYSAQILQALFPTESMCPLENGYIDFDSLIIQQFLKLVSGLA